MRYSHAGVTIGGWEKSAVAGSRMAVHVVGLLEGSVYVSACKELCTHSDCCQFPEDELCAKDRRLVSGNVNAADLATL